ncbi:PAS domain S-box protein [Candidatus Bathyarchaeota archaeon]|nr:PAS domain S-box protein [Candidatus Bathyarchaeota archaeon]
MVTDLNGNIIECNQATLKLHEYSSKEELIGKNAFELIAKKDHQKAMENLKKTLEQCNVRNIDYTLITKNGREFSGELSSSVIKNSSGELIGFVAITKDITERKKAEDETRNLARFPLEDTSPILRIAADGTIMFTNPAAKPLLEEWESGIGQPAPEHFRRIVTEVIASGQRSDVEVKFGDNIFSFLFVPIVDGDHVNAYGRDITNHKRLEHALQESEDKYRVIVESSPNLVLIYQDGCFKYVNGAACRMLGWTYEELTSPTFNVIERLVPERFQALLKENIAKRLNGEAIPPYEVSLKTRDNIEFPVTVLAQRILYREKFAEEIILVDITERKQKENLYRELAESISDTFFAMDRNLRYTYWNKASENLTGIKAEDAIGKSIFEVFPDREDTRKSAAVYQRVLQTQQHETVINEFQLEGKGYFFEIDAYPTKEGVSVFVSDITERKHMEDELRAKEERFRTIFEGATDGILLADPETGKFFMGNKMICQMLGYSLEELKDLGTMDIHPKEDLPYVLGEFKKQMTGEIKLTKDVPVKRRDGSIFYADINAAPITEVGKTYLMGIFRDVSERKMMNEKLRLYSEHLEILVEERTKALSETHERLLVSERLAAIGELAGMVGHDLRNPLQVIFNTLYVAGKKAESMPIEDREIFEKTGFSEFSKTLSEQVEYMNKIVSGLQDYAKQLKPELVETDLHHLIDGTLSTIAIPENIAVSILIEDDFPLLMIDSSMMKRVFTNLASNAVQAMSEGGKLMIRASETEEDVLISVGDTGVGISEENLSKLFSPLFTTKAKGTGLGLPICKRMVEAHEGSITVESEVGKGSAFTIRIPRRMGVNKNG